MIVLARDGGAEAALRAVRLGAGDYLIKRPASFLRLPLGGAVGPGQGAPAGGLRLGLARIARIAGRSGGRVAVFSATPQGRLLNASPGFLRLLGVGDLESAKDLDLEPFVAAAAGWGASQGVPGAGGAPGS